jgi:predicted alpha/beta superfamily hydrolase
MGRAFLAVVCAALLAGCTGGTRPYALADTQVLDLPSADRAHELSLFVSLPRGYDRQPGARFPIIYLLDADYSFAIARNELRHFTDRGQAHEAILVGIAYPGAEADIDLYHRTRVRDYTPTQTAGSGYDAEMDKISGHAPEFLKQIEEQVIPAVERRFRADPAARMLVGHSYGGLFATWTMLTRPGLFRDYLIVSPSYWYDDKTIFRLEDAYVASHGDLTAHVFYGVGSLEGGGSMAADMQAFDARMTARNYAGYRSTAQVFEGETHNSIFPAALSRGLRTLYGFAGEDAAKP